MCRIPIPGCTVSPAAPGTGTPTAIRLPHVNAELFRQFILYVYTAKVGVQLIPVYLHNLINLLSDLQLMLQDYRVFEMLTLAQDMGVFELRAACEDHVISTLSVDNACTFLTAVMDIHEKAGE